MNKLLLGAAAAALSLTPVAASAQRATGALIIIVDTDTIFRTCTACVAAQSQLQSMINALQQQQQTLSAPIQAEAQAVETAANAARAMPAGAARTAAEAGIQARVAALQTRQNQANQTLQRQEQNIRSSQANVSQQLSARLDPIVRQVMTARGANIVLPKAATLGSSDALEVTSEVLAALNQQLPAVTVAPLPQAAAPATTPPTTRPQGR